MANNNAGMSKFITAFICVVVGVALLTQIALSTNAATSASNRVTGESLTITSARLVGGGINPTVMFSLADNGPLCSPGILTGSLVVANTNGTIAATNYSYSATTRQLNFLNTTYMVSGVGGNYNTTTLAYSAYPDGYLCQGWDATVLNLVPGFFALALLGVGVALFYGMGKDYGLY